MHQQFNIQQLYALSTLYLCVLYLSENSDLCHLQHKLVGFYNRDEKCLQRGTNWVFKKSSLRFVFKRLRLKLESSFLLMLDIFPLATVLKTRLLELRGLGHFTPWY